MFAVIGVAMTRFMIEQSSAMSRGNEVTSARQNVRAALHRISADIRLVGQGLNFYDLQVPDLIVPNDGSVSVGTYTDNSISLISIPDPSDPNNMMALDPGVPNNGQIGSTAVDVDPGSSLAGVAIGERIILFDPNSGNSQVVTLTNINGLTLEFLNDALVFNFPAIGLSPANLLKLNEVRYRVNVSGPIPWVERKVNNGNWTRYVEGVSAIRFDYFNSLGNSFTPTTQAARRDIRRIDVDITGVALRLSRGAERRASLSLTSTVVPRNMLPAP